MGKLVFLDIDGTLLTAEQQVPESSKKAIAQAQANGHKVFICSGRNIKNVPTFLQELVDGIVCATGAYVRIGNEVILNESIAPEKLLGMQKLLEAHDAKYYFLGEGGIYILPNEKERWLKYREEIKSPPAEQFTSLFREVESYEGMDGLSGCDYADADISAEELHAIADRELDGYFTVTGASFGDDHVYCGEVTRRGISKGSGMEMVAKYFGLTREDTIGVGDGMNDFDMLRYAGTAVAMGNAVSELKKEADYVTSSIYEDGIWNAFVHLGLIEEV